MFHQVWTVYFCLGCSGCCFGSMFSFNIGNSLLLSQLIFYSIFVLSENNIWWNIFEMMSVECERQTRWRHWVNVLVLWFQSSLLVAVVPMHSVLGCQGREFIHDHCKLFICCYLTIWAYLDCVQLLITLDTDMMNSEGWEMLTEENTDNASVLCCSILNIRNSASETFHIPSRCFQILCS